MRHRAVACAARIVQQTAGGEDRVALLLDITLPPALAR
jgi:hypothetical protein